MKQKSINKFQNEIKIDEILERLKIVKGFSRDSEISTYLGINRNTLSTYKSRNKVPYEILLSICELDGINFYWLLTGNDQDSNKNDSSIPTVVVKTIKEYPVIERLIKLFCVLDDDSIRNIETFINKITLHEKELLKVKNRLSELESKIEVK